MLLLSVLLAAVFGLLSLWGFSPEDPTWTRPSLVGAAVSNPCGPLGANVSDLLYRGFGWGAWVVLGTVVGAAVTRLARRPLGGFTSWAMGLWLFVSALGLIELSTAPDSGLIHTPAGRLGAFVASSLSAVVGVVGAWLVLLSAVAVALGVLSGVSWGQVASAVLSKAEAELPAIREQAKLAGGTLGAWSWAAAKGVWRVGLGTIAALWRGTIRGLKALGDLVLGAGGVSVRVARAGAAGGTVVAQRGFAGVFHVFGRMKGSVLRTITDGDEPWQTEHPSIASLPSEALMSELPPDPSALSSAAGPDAEVDEVLDLFPSFNLRGQASRRGARASLAGAGGSRDVLDDVDDAPSAFEPLSGLTASPRTAISPGGRLAAASGSMGAAAKEHRSAPAAPVPRELAQVGAGASSASRQSAPAAAEVSVGRWPADPGVGEAASPRQARAPQGGARLGGQERDGAGLAGGAASGAVARSAESGSAGAGQEGPSARAHTSSAEGWAPGAEASPARGPVVSPGPVVGPPTGAPPASAPRGLAPSQARSSAPASAPSRVPTTSPRPGAASPAIAGPVGQPAPSSDGATAPAVRAAAEAGVRIAPADGLSNSDADDDGNAVGSEGGLFFRLPPLSLLDEVQVQEAPIDEAGLRALAVRVEECLASFKIGGTVTDVRVGPVVTTLEFAPEAGVRVNRITGLEDDLKMALCATSVRVIAPIPGKGVVGIEIPSDTRMTIFFREVLASRTFRDHKGRLKMVIGKDVEGKACVVDLAKMPHLLVAGTTGAGKSVSVNALLMSLLYTHTPDSLRLLLIDPKQLEFESYSDIPHLLHPVVSDVNLAGKALEWACREMDRRYGLMKSWGVRSLDAYNAKVERETRDWSPAKARQYAPEDWPDDAPAPQPEHLPYIVVVIDELADLMMQVRKEVEEPIARLAQKARACGIHLIIATQRPSSDVITGVIKANMPGRLSLKVRQALDSRIVLDAGGAENLLDKGDALLLLPSAQGDARRVHGPFVSDDEVSRVAAFLREQAQPSFVDGMLDDDEPADDGPVNRFGDEDRDPLFDDALQIVTEQGGASTSYIQRCLRIGYTRAARIVDQMEAAGIVGPPNGSKPRELLVGSGMG